MVALKVVEPIEGRTREDVVAEGVLLFNLQHAGIPTIREHFFVDDHDRKIPEGDRYVVAMDWVEGIDLEEELRTRGAPGLALNTVIDYVEQAASALEHLHQHDPPIVHGDVKPANLVHRKDGKIVLVDFGIARAAGSRPREGTKGYAAPEVATGQPSSTAQDVYALAATTLTLLTGREPVLGPPELDGAVDPDEIGPLKVVLQRALDPDPVKRPGAIHLAERLKIGARSFPQGTLTFLAGEVADADSLWERDADAMDSATQWLENVVATIVDDHGGRVVTAGETFLAVFPFPSDAASTAVALHGRLAQQSIPGGVPLALRIGLHTGEARTVNNRYTGATLAHASRLRSRAHVRATVVSSNTAQLLRANLAEGTRILTTRGPDGIEQLVLVGPHDDEPERVTEPVSRPPRRVSSEPTEITPSRRVSGMQALDELSQRIDAVRRRHGDDGDGEDAGESGPEVTRP
jgi:serine/threonine protein kinase